jgi:hypothetical protein
VRRRSTTTWWLLVLLCATGGVCAQETPQPSPQPAAPPPQSDPKAASPATPGDTAPEATGPQPDHQWLDRTQQGVQDLATHSAQHLDRLFGPEEDEAPYRAATGSIAPAVLWDEFNGWQPKVRFHVDLPLPQMNERFNAFIGRVNRDEYVSESAPQSGAFERQYGPPSDEQTLAGVSYHTPTKQGGRFDAGTGVRLRFPLDPYLKGSYLYELGKSQTGLLSLRQTVFWQNSEHAGFTTRADLERVFADKWLVRWTTSASISERSDGVFGYSSIRALRGFPNRRAVAVEIGFDGETNSPVPLHEYGIKAAYRQSVMRDWLVLELRSSLTYPKEQPGQSRQPSWGVGIGFEMFFGTNEFLARPVTF